MVKIKCPNCKSEIVLDENDYSDVVSQVRNEEFNKELEKRVKDAISLRDAENNVVLAQKEKDAIKKIGELNEIIKELRTKLQSSENAVDDKIKTAVAEKEKDTIQKIGELNGQIKELQTKLENSESGVKDKIIAALAEKEKEIIQLQNDVKQQELKAIQELTQIKSENEIILRGKDAEIAQLKDFKIALNNKLVGEELEQYCARMFNQIRAAAFPNCVFEKDNKVSDDGTKGDFIFRDYADGVEYISIMFEMKNESINSVNKHKNEDFFKKLDKDRKDKNCEYAVLVSTLEPENDSYNVGIFDASYAYEKMYVIRPQAFLTLISILCHAGRNTVKVKKELEELKNQNIDITNFENKLIGFKDRFTKNVAGAKAKFEAAIVEIDKSIKALEKVKEDLNGSIKSLEKADDIAAEVTIKKLTYGNPTMKRLFEESKKDDDAQ